MPHWYYDKADLKRTPSNQDNLNNETEQRYRREGARFIINVGTTMGLRFDTMATGVVYFHRFYMFHSFRIFPRYVTACCCLFLAGKVEETPKKCKDIIKTARTLLADKYFAQFGDDPKEEVMTLERILLQTIKFDLQVDHPYSYLLKYAKSLRGDKTKVQKLVQMAWTFVNDSLCTTLCLQWEPEIIAIALMYLASKLSKFEIADWVGRTSKHVRWWDVFVEDMTVELLEDICHQVLDLYSTPATGTPKDSPPISPAPSTTSVKGRPPTPLPSSKSDSPIKVEPHAPITPVGVGPTANQVLTAISPAVPLKVASAPLLTTPTGPPTPVTTPIIVGQPIPRLGDNVTKPVLTIAPGTKVLLPLADPGMKPLTPNLISPIPSLAPGHYGPPSSKPLPPKPPLLQDEPYPYVKGHPLPPPPVPPPFQNPPYRDSPSDNTYTSTTGYRAKYQYPDQPGQYYGPDNNQYYGSNGNGGYPPGHGVRPPYPEGPYAEGPYAEGYKGGPPLHQHPHPPNHPHPPAHPHPHPPVHPHPPYEGEGRPYPPVGAPYPPPPRPHHPPNASEGPYHYNQEGGSSSHVSATGIPTVRITGRY